jgi:membrane protease YdiL (CAAX protease family)
LSARGALAYATYCIALNLALTVYTRSDAVSGSVRGVIGSIAGRLGAPTDVVAALVSGILMVSVYALVLAPVVVIGRRRGVRFREQVGLRPFKVGPAIGMTAIMIPLGLCIGFQYALLLLRLGVRYQGNTAGLTRVFGASPIGILVLFGVGAVVAPFVEEIAFRGVLFSSLRESWREPSAILVSSALFGVIHLDPLAMIPTAIVGLMLARVFLATRSLWVSILAHSTYNALVLGIALMTQRLVG